MTATVQERVAHGVVRLDEEVPGWPDRVDRSTLAISSTCLCVVGQVFGPSPGAPGWQSSLNRYREGLATLGVEDDVEDGFRGLDCEDDAALEREWARVIAERMQP